MYNIEIDALLTAAECSELIEWFTYHPQKRHVDVANDVMYSRHGTGGAVADGTHYRGDYLLTYDIEQFRGTPFQQAIDRVMQACTHDNVEFDWASIVSTYPDCDMLLHKDRATVDAHKETATTQVYTCIVYLNDDYGGGHLIVPPLLRYKPSSGQMLQMVGSDRQHGVETVVGSPRYTLSVWFTIKNV